MNAHLLILKGLVADATPEERAEFEKALAEVRAVVTKHGDYGCIAASMVLLEAEEKKKD